MDERTRCAERRRGVRVAFMQLEGIVAVITGAGRGIGREIALAYAAEGADVVLAARSGDALEQTAGRVREEHGREALVVPTDLLDPAQIEALETAARERFSRVDVLVNNSGVSGPTKLLWETDPEEWRETIAVNLTGVFLCCRAFLPGMVERGAGSIVSVGSIIGKRPVWGRTPYAASKLGLVGLTRTLATEAGPYGVRVNSISPGAVEGERLDQVLSAQAKRSGATLEEAKAQFASLAPLERLTTPSDVAAAAVFLASPASEGITGEDLNVNAGLVMH